MQEMSDPEKEIEQQPNNPLHGVKLLEILQALEDVYGWEEMGRRSDTQKCPDGS